MKRIIPLYAAASARRTRPASNGNGLYRTNTIIPPNHLSIPVLAPLVALLLWLGGGTGLAETRYVWTNSPSPTWPFTSWATAARTVQPAVDAAQTGDTVLVTNGIYSTGGKATYGTMTNRVAVNKAIIVQSVNGPGATWIVGAGYGSDDGAIRCAYVGTNAILSGFTLTNGHTRTSGDADKEQRGGGVWCEVSAVVTNCALWCNLARFDGGGSCYGTLNNCALWGNYAYSDGGGSYYSTLNNCTLSDNWAGYYGGGSYYGTLNNCTLTSNHAYAYGNDVYGGGSFRSTLNNCTLTGNSATSEYYGGYGGGSYGGALNNCTLTGNSAANYGGGSCNSTLSNCILNTNSADSGGGSYGGALNNCVLIHNFARWGGGSEGGTLNNCTLTGNSAGNYNGGSDGGTLNNCIVYYNTAPASPNYYGCTFTYSCSTPQPSGTGNISANPMFVTPPGGDVRLLPDSPCIDAGNDSIVQPQWVDLDGNPRIMGPHVDMGAYEFRGDTNRPAFVGLNWVTNQVARGSNVSVFVTLAPNTNRPSFQWYLNGVAPLPGQTASNLVLNAAKLNDAGIYSVVVSNRNGSATGIVMTLRVTYQIANPVWTRANSKFSLYVQTEFGRASWLEARDNLETGAWRVIGGLTNNWDGWSTLVDTNASGPRRFYRIGSAPWP